MWKNYEKKMLKTLASRGIYSYAVKIINSINFAF